MPVQIAAEKGGVGCNYRWCFLRAYDPQTLWGLSVGMVCPCGKVIQKIVECRRNGRDSVRVRVGSRIEE